MGVAEGRVAIVAGGSRGMGAEVGRRFAAAGATVAVAARTTEPGTSPLPGTIGETAAQIRAAGGTAVAIAADLAKPADRERLVQQAPRPHRPPGHPGGQPAAPEHPPRQGFTPRRAPTVIGG